MIRTVSFWISRILTDIMRLLSIGVKIVCFKGVERCITMSVKNIWYEFWIWKTGSRGNGKWIWIYMDEKLFSMYKIAPNAFQPDKSSMV